MSQPQWQAGVCQPAPLSTSIGLSRQRLESSQPFLFSITSFFNDTEDSKDFNVGVVRVLSVLEKNLITNPSSPKPLLLQEKGSTVPQVPLSSRRGDERG